jgi:cytochrome c6
MTQRVVVVLTCLALLLAVVPRMAAAGPDGAAIYKAKCAMCHGPDGAGQTPTGKSMKVGDLRSPDVQKMSDKDLTAIITDGKGKMPAYKGKVTEAEISALVELVRKLK